MANENIITQLSIFVNNEPGRLATIAAVLKECNVDMIACNLAESTEFGILRAIVKDPEDSFNKIKNKGIIVKKTDIIGVKIGNGPGALFAAADILGKSGINIEYGYAYSAKDVNVMFIRVDDPEKAVKTLKDAKFDILSDKEI